MSDLTQFRDHCRTMVDAQHKRECWGEVSDRWGPKRVHPDPACGGCVTDAERALWTRLADEIDDHLTPHPDLFGGESVEPRESA